MKALAKDAFLLDPSVIYLNHGSFGACPLLVLARQSEIRALLEREPVRFFERHHPELLDRTRARVAAWLCADPAGLVFVPNATVGVGTVLASLPLEGQTILSTNHAYPAVRRALEAQRDRRGAVLRVVDLPFPVRDPGEYVERVLAASAGATLAVLDHVTSQTGLVFPLETLARELSARGVEVLVDGAHAPGMVPLDLGALGVAYYTGNFHKWVCAPKGAAFLFVREDRRRGVRPLAISHEFPWRPGLGAEFDFAGTHDPSAILSVPTALDFLAGLVDPPTGGLPALMQRNRTLALGAREVLMRAVGLKDPPCPASMIGSLASVPLPHPVSPDPLHASLFDEDGIEVPIFGWGGQRLIRVSAQVYNSVEEYERLARALTRRDLVWR